jgi:lysophospholipase L1-like esterase
MTIKKLVAGAKGAAGNSTGADIAETVNGLIDTNRTKRAACMGVSFMAQQTQNGPNSFIFRDIGYLTHLFCLTGWPWRWDMSCNFAVGGALTSAMITDQLPNVLSSHAVDPIEIIFISAGTNDAQQLIPYNTIISNLNQIIENLTSVGIRVVFESIYPRGVDAAILDYKRVSLRINKWLEQQAINGRIDFIDVNSVLADLTTNFGNIVAGLTYDPSIGVHPNTKGARLISRIFHAYFKDKVYPTITYATQNNDVFDAVHNPTGNIFDNPMLTGGTTAPTGYLTGGGTWSPIDVVLPSGQVKRTWRVALTASTSHFLYDDIVKSGAWVSSDRIQPGDKLEGRCRVIVTGATGLRSVRFFIQESDGSATPRRYICLGDSTINELNSMDGTYTYDLKTPVCTVRPYSGNGNASIFIRCEFITESSGVAGTCTVESFELRKV